MKRELSDDDYRCLAEFRHQLRAFMAFSEQQARLATLTPAQHQLLLAVRGCGGNAPTIGELAARLVLKHHSTVELIDRLERRGLVKRVREGTDRRVSRIELTARGSSVLLELTLAHREELRRRGPELARSLSRLLASRSALRRPPGKRKAVARARSKEAVPA